MKRLIAVPFMALFLCLFPIVRGFGQGPKVVTKPINT